MPTSNLLITLLRLALGVVYATIGATLWDLSLILGGVTEAILCVVAIGNLRSAQAYSRGLTGVAPALLYLVGAIVVPVRTGTTLFWPAFQLVGCLVLLWSVYALRSSYTAGVPSWVTLRDTGPYRYVRHPQAAAGMLMRWAFALEHLCAWNLGIAALLTVTICGGCVLEEKFLWEFAEWRAYASRVRCRWFPALI